MAIQRAELSRLDTSIALEPHASILKIPALNLVRI